MSEVLFYHLERASLKSVLPGLLEKTLERGWKAVVRCGENDRVKSLDEHLWTYRDDAFLPHGAGGDGSRHPIWLTAGEDNPNDAQVLFAVDGARVDPAAIDGLERCILIFDGGDDAAVEDARNFWKKAAENGHSVTYWRQSPQGRWEKQSR